MHILLRLFILSFILIPFFGASQRPSDIHAGRSKRFIDRFEVVAGPSISFNSGNKFVDNYQDDLMENKRLKNFGYSLGVGLYHPLNRWLDLNARILWEKKGSNAELNVPLNPVNNDARQIIQSTYTYDYLTLGFLPQVFIGKEKRITLSIGGYYSFMNSVEGHEEVLTTDDDVTYNSTFNGRVLRGFRSDGAVNSISFIPGLQSFEKDDYGITMGIGYVIGIGGHSNIAIQLVDNFGLQNINKPVAFLENPPERNHTLSLIIGYVYSRPWKTK